MIAAAIILTAGLTLLCFGLILERVLPDETPAPAVTEDSAEWLKLRAAVDGPDFTSWEREWSA